MVQYTSPVKGRRTDSDSDIWLTLLILNEVEYSADIWRCARQAYEGVPVTEQVMSSRSFQE